MFIVTNESITAHTATMIVATTISIADITGITEV